MGRSKESRGCSEPRSNDDLDLAGAILQPRSLAFREAVLGPPFTAGKTERFPCEPRSRGISLLRLQP